jgi:hypothetical protein
MKIGFNSFNQNFLKGNKISSRSMLSQTYIFKIEIQEMFMVLIVTTEFHFFELYSIFRSPFFQIKTFVICFLL